MSITARLFNSCLALLVAVPCSATPTTRARHRQPRAELFAPGIVSTRDYERDGTFSPDGKTFYFTKRTIWPYFSAICVTRRTSGGWSTPEVAPFSGRYPDSTPFVSGDGSRIYFASRRPARDAAGLSATYGLWMAERSAAGAWSAPHSLPEPINGHGSVFAPNETAHGLYFIGGDDPHVLFARRHGDAWDPPVLAGDANAPGSAEVSAYVDPRERFMIVSVIGREDAMHSAEGIYPRADLYVRERTGGAWSSLRHLPAPINSDAEDITPSVSRDGKYLYFSSERGAFTAHGAPFTYESLERALHAPGNGLGDIYRIDFSATGIVR